MTEPSNESNPTAIAQRLRISYEEARAERQVPGARVRTIDAAREAVEALRAAAHAEFSVQEDDRERVDAVLDALSGVAEGFVAMLDRQQRIVEASDKVRAAHDAYAVARKYGKGLARETREKRKVYDQLTKDLLDVISDQLTRPVGGDLWSVAGLSIQGLAKGLRPPTPRVIHEDKPWDENPVLLRALHELVKTAHAAPGSFAELDASLRKQLDTMGVVVVDELRDDTVHCFDPFEDGRLPAGEEWVEEPALAKLGSEGRLIPLPGRKGLFSHGPFRTIDKESS